MATRNCRESRAWKRGYDDYGKGLDLSCSPNFRAEGETLSALRDAWFDGWFDAECDAAFSAGICAAREESQAPCPFDTGREDWIEGWTAAALSLQRKCWIGDARVH